MSASPLPITPDIWLHILFGDENGGGHLAGHGIEGKSEFPDYWSISRIESAIMAAQENILARNGGVFVGEYDELVDGILLRLVIKKRTGTGSFIRTAYPLRGNGVFRNVNGMRLSRPLLRQDRKK